MFRFALPIACAMSLACTVTVQAQNDTLRATVERFVGNPVQQQMMDDMLSADAMIAQMRAVMPQLTDAQLQLVGGIGAEEMATLRPALEAAMVSAAVETFTLEEILALEAFYNTPEGAAVMAKMQPYMASAMGRIGPEMQAAQMRITQRVMIELSSQ
jgi:hypothetical protein